MAEKPSSSLVDGTKVGGATNVTGGTGDPNDATAGLADDVASQNAANANAVPRGTGTKTSWGSVYQVGAGGQTQGGY